MTDFLSGFPGSKALAGVFLATIAIIEISRGFLKPFPAYCKHSSSPWRFPLAFVAVGFISVFALLPFDVWIIQKIQAIQNQFALSAIKFGSFWGRSQNTWKILGVLYFVFWILRKEKIRGILWGTFLSSALTSLIIHILKHISLRARPYFNTGPYDFFNIQGFTQDYRAYQSFPSGDVAAAAGAAAFLFFALRKKGGIFFMILPVLVMLSRTMLNKHWPSDTAFSLWLGLGVAFFVWSYTQYRAAAISK